MDKEIILDYKKASGKSLIDSFIVYKSTSFYKYSMMISMHEFKNSVEKQLIFGSYDKGQQEI